jgi:hypothetical protein
MIAAAAPPASPAFCQTGITTVVAGRRTPDIGLNAEELRARLDVMTLMAFQRATPSAVRNLIELWLLLSLRKRMTELVTLTRVGGGAHRLRHKWLLLIQDRRHHRLRRTRLHRGELLELMRRTPRLLRLRLLKRMTQLVTLTPVGLGTSQLWHKWLLLLLKMSTQRLLRLRLRNV